MKLILNADELRKIALPHPPMKTCTCGVGACPGWESITEDRWPAAQMQPVATMRNPDIGEPSYEEHHPDGTRYESPDAPVAVKFFPYNRCDIWRCSQCERQLMRYTEFGGYYIDHRVRELSDHLRILD